MIMELLTNNPHREHRVLQVTTCFNVPEGLEYCEETELGFFRDTAQGDGIGLLPQGLGAVEDVGRGSGGYEKVDEFLVAVAMVADERCLRGVHLLGKC